MLDDWPIDELFDDDYLHFSAARPADDVSAADSAIVWDLLDISEARSDAARRKVDVEYVEADLRSISWSERFDVVVSWFTAFGYFDGLDGAAAALTASSTRMILIAQK